MRRNSSKDLEIRELPDGARQSDENYELTFEQPAEGSNDQKQIGMRSCSV